MPDMLGAPGDCGSAAHEQAGFDVLADSGLGEVRAADQQHLAVGDGELRVHLRRLLGPPLTWPVPYLHAGNGQERDGWFLASEGATGYGQGLDHYDRGDSPRHSGTKSVG